ncbi:MAG TPA: hypothetical protein VI431_12010 [Candidatus Acidoferrum sp.]
MASRRKLLCVGFSSTVLKVAVLLALAVVPAYGQVNKQRAEEQKEYLKQNLLNQTLETKISIGNCVTKPVLSQLATVLVDTEIHADLTVSYLHRGLIIGTAGGAGTRCLEGDYQVGVVREMRPGTIVTVRRIEMKGDRFELALEGPKSGVGGPGIGSTYGRLKFLYGGQYSSDSAPLVMLMYVSKVLRLKAFERIEEARQQYRNLVWELASAYDESRFQALPQPNEEEAFRRLVQNTASHLDRPQIDNRLPANEQIRRLRTAQGVLQKILDNRDEYMAAVQQLDAASLLEPADKKIWEQVRGKMQARLVELEARVKEERKQELRSSLEQKRKEYEGQKALLPKSAPRGLDQVSSVMDRDDQCLALLDQRRSLLNELAQLGEAQTSSEIAEIEKEQTQLQQLRQQWEGIRRPLELSRLNEDYTELTIRFNELDRRSHADASVQTTLRALLEQRRANRERALELGEPRAAKQLEDIQRKLAALQ